MCKLYILNQIARASLGNVLQFMPVAKAAIQVGAVSPLTILDAKCQTQTCRSARSKTCGILPHPRISVVGNSPFSEMDAYALLQSASCN